MTAGAGGTLKRWRFDARPAGRFALIALGATIPVSTALDGILTGVLVAAWLVSARFDETAAAVRTNPAARIACIWFLAHLAGALYSSGDPLDVWSAVTKSATFLLIPIGTVMMTRRRDVEYAHMAFMAAIAVTVVLAVMRMAGFVPYETALLKAPDYSPSVVFKYHLTQNLLVALGAFLFAVYATRIQRRDVRHLFTLCAAACAANVLFVGDGRTGQIVLIVLALYYGWWRNGVRGLAVALAGAAVLAAAAYAIPGSSLHKRTETAVIEAETAKAGAPPEKSSVGQRLEYHEQSASIVLANPLFGVGSGGFPAAYLQQALRDKITPTSHPHNEYLRQLVELGVFGPLLMLALFRVHWRAAGELPDARHTAAMRGLVLMYAVSCLGSSMLNDHTELMLYVWMSALAFAFYRRPAA